VSLKNPIDFNPQNILRNVTKVTKALFKIEKEDKNKELPYIQNYLTHE